MRTLTLALAAGLMALALLTTPDTGYAQKGGGTSLTGPGQLYVVKDHTDHVPGLAFTPDGKQLLSASADGTVRVMNARTSKTNRILAHPHVHSVAVSPDGKKVATLGWGGNGEVHIWDLESGAELIKWGGDESLNNVSFNPEGTRILYAAYGAKALRLADVATGKVIFQFGEHGANTEAAALSSDGKRAISGSEDGTIRVWSTLTGKELKRQEAHKGGVNGVAISLDGKWAVSGGVDKVVRIWDLPRLEPSRALEGHTKVVDTLAVSKDGRWIASGGDDQVVRLWDATTGNAAQVFKGHKGGVYALAFSPDSRQLASGGEDHTVRMWRLPK